MPSVTWCSTPSARGSTRIRNGATGLSSFGVDHDGELHVTAASGVYRIGFDG
jgi:hypothetical protein